MLRQFLTRRSLLLLGLVVCAVLQLAAVFARKLRPAFPGTPVAAAGAFTPDGWRPGEPLASAPGLRLYGSWSGDDRHTGSIAIGPFVAPAVLRFAVGGYPENEGISLFLSNELTGARHPIEVAAVGERWVVVDVRVPPDWIGQRVSLVGVDDAPGFWLALSEPLSGGRGEGLGGLLDSLAALALNGLVLGLLWRWALSWVARLAWLPAPWAPLVGWAGVAVAGYVIFWCYFAHPTAGRLAFWLLALGAALAVARGPRLPAAISRESLRVSLLTVAVGCFHLSSLHLYQSSRSLSDLAANRYRSGLPADNALPADLTKKLFAGQPLRETDAEWQSSDRPPLEAGWDLLTAAFCAAASVPVDTATQTASIWFQLLWVPAAYGLFRTLRLEPAPAAASTALLSFSGFFLVHTVYVWPKLSAAALMLGAFALWTLEMDSKNRLGLCTAGAALAALGCLSHGGVAFALLAVLPWILWRWARGERRPWFAAALMFCVLTAPWLVYQRVYDPPGNRLVKWHLGGQEARDSRGAWATIRAGYHRRPWRETLAAKAENVATLFGGDWPSMFRFDRAGAAARQQDEFFYTFRALGWWLAGLAFVDIGLLRPRLRETRRPQLALLAWAAATALVWCALMFTGGHTVLHQGSFTLPLVLFVLLTTWLTAAGRLAIFLLSAGQLLTLATTYFPPNATVWGAPVATPVLALSLAALLCFIVVPTTRQPLFGE